MVVVMIYNMVKFDVRPVFTANRWQRSGFFEVTWLSAEKMPMTICKRRTISIDSRLDHSARAQSMNSRYSIEIKSEREGFKRSSAEGSKNSGISYCSKTIPDNPAAPSGFLTRLEHYSVLLRKPHLFILPSVSSMLPAASIAIIVRIIVPTSCYPDLPARELHVNPRPPSSSQDSFQFESELPSSRSLKVTRSVCRTP